jgi:hypothetical protein
MNQDPHMNPNPSLSHQEIMVLAEIEEAETWITKAKSYGTSIATSIRSLIAKWLPAGFIFVTMVYVSPVAGVLTMLIIGCSIVLYERWKRSAAAIDDAETWTTKAKRLGLWFGPPLMLAGFIFVIYEFLGPVASVVALQIVAGATALFKRWNRRPQGTNTVSS